MDKNKTKQTVGAQPEKARNNWSVTTAQGVTVTPIVYLIQRRDKNGVWHNYNPKPSKYAQKMTFTMARMARAGVNPQIGDWRLKLQ